jgi:hypothetical protein
MNRNFEHGTRDFAVLLKCPSVLGSRRRKILSKSQVATSRDDLHLVSIVLKAGFQLVIRIGIVLHSWPKSWLWKISITPGCKYLFPGNRPSVSSIF